MPRRYALLLFLAVACGRDAASDRDDVSLEPPKPPCDGCTLDVPPRTDPIPLLVVLHGNDESAGDAADRWRPAALSRGWAVLALRCPRGDGCDERGRWYRWRGEPDWVFAQVAEASRDRAFDRRRIYLAGWSGGASYMGLMAPHWHRRFAAVVFHGGGQPPAEDGCPRDLPAYFLVGDRNPAHPSAIRLRTYWEQCGQEVRWDLVEGANHAKEDEALDAVKAMQILGWLDRRARAPLVSVR
jgi:poly(3-hydroxybutyrate) depolymerase